MTYSYVCVRPFCHWTVYSSLKVRTSVEKLETNLGFMLDEFYCIRIG